MTSGARSVAATAASVARRALVALLPIRALRERWTLTVLLGLLYGWLFGRDAWAGVTDPDVWWLAAAGRDMLARGDVPRVNGYGFTAPLHPWVMHEWLYGVLLACGARLAGPWFFALVTIACGAASAVALILLASAGARDRAAVGLALLIGSSVAAVHGARPSSAAVALALTMALLAFCPGWSTRRTGLVVLLEWIWTQAHGSFPLGLVLLAAAAFEDRRDRAARRPRAFALALAGLVTFLNPYGARLHDLVRQYLTGDDPSTRAIHATVIEFRPLWRAGPIWASPPFLVALGVAVALAISALAHRRHVARALLTLTLGGMAVAQARHLDLAVLLGSALLVVEIDDLLQQAAVGEPTLPTAPWRLVAETVLPGALVGLVVWTTTLRTRNAEAEVHASLGGPWVPTLAAALPAGAHVYAPFLASSVILWEAAPRGVRVFFDPRNDCYPPDVILASAALPTDPAADRHLVERGADHAIVRDDSVAGASLAASAAWKRVETAGPWALYTRSTPGS